MFYLTEANILKLINRQASLFLDDVNANAQYISKEVSGSSFLVIGGAGSIGRAVVKELFIRNPKKLHVIDISENGLAELVRDIRSTLGYIDGEFKAFALDVGSDIFDRFLDSAGRYDYVLNFSALKHVRSEKDKFTLMRMIEVNILNTIKTVKYAQTSGAKKYFCVSTDKASRPVNMMGATKRIMELFLWMLSDHINISTARFANVAFSDGSLLHGFLQRIQKRQPIAAPKDIRRVFVTPEESGRLCLLSAILGKNRQIFFPKLDMEKEAITFWDVLERLLRELGFEPYICRTEEEAREKASILPKDGKWACYASPTDTTGEKEIEEFYSPQDKVVWDRFKDVAFIEMECAHDTQALERFLDELETLRRAGVWDKKKIVSLFQTVLPEFRHYDTGRYLDDKM